jgi:23S rRNA pseudouridine1911/1915/1917 synthase
VSIDIIYEDNHIIALVKPAGVLSQGDLPAGRQVKQDTMLERARFYLKEKYKKPGNVFVGLLHRLDRPVSGIMLFAKTSKGASRLSEQFRNQTVQKTYQAIVVGKPPKDRGVLVNHLMKDEKLKKARHNPAPGSGAREAVLHYEVLKSNETYSLLKISIEGGQFHQIRTQLSLAGMPVLGDVKYLPAGRQVKGRWNNEKAIALCATGISFKTATGDQVINLAIDIPKEWPKLV